MSLLKQIVLKLDNRINPIVVKEMRQAVQGKFIMSTLLLFLVVAVAVVAIIALSWDPDEVDFEAGQEVFVGFYVILLVACLLLLPLYACLRLSMERSGTNIDLMFSTVLKPWRIVSGKLWATTLLGVLMYATCMPFMTITYLLRGIDLVGVFTLLLLGFAFMVLAVQMALFIAALPVGKILKGLIVLAFVGGSISAISLMGNMAYSMFRYGMGRIFSSGSIGVWPVVLTYTISVLSSLGLLYVLTVAMLSPSSSNRALPVRIYLTVFWLVQLGMSLYLVYSSGEVTVIISWLAPSMILFLLAFLAGISEREKLGPRVARTIPQRRYLRLLAFLFYSGAAGGIIWSLLMMAATLAVTYDVLLTVSLPGILGRGGVEEFLHNFLCLALYVVAYGMAALFLRRKFLKKRIKPVMTWTLALILMLLGSITPLMVVFFAKRNQMLDYDDWILFSLNPFGVFGYSRMFSVFFSIGCVAAIITTLLNLGWFFRQIKAFKPYQSPGQISGNDPQGAPDNSPEVPPVLFSPEVVPVEVDAG